ncbi:hypothetical protein EMPS_07101 [Entomortierella parvispora]|uniref:Uncharacterized protein n=1 Tax=Entomortierella parvispora TaxID=205924 RepID=A0A9P3HDY8_9FUNG|nr:hypothetical protein EMPS_07101 [Entomortierella parvispora]
MNSAETSCLYETVDSRNTFTIAGNTYGSGAHDEQLMFPPEMLLDNREPWKSMARYSALARTLRRDLSWTLSLPVLEQIQELSLPLSDLDRYLEIVSRFQSLTTVTFIKDELLELLESTFPSISRSNAELEELEKCKQKQHQQYRTMIAFVQSHGRLFPNQLQNVYLSADRGLPFYPDDIKEDLDSALSPLARPKFIDPSNWKRVANNIKESDLGSVKSIVLSCPATKDAPMVFLKNDPNFWSRCRSLEKFNMRSLGSGSFRWAVDEKVAWDRSLNERTIVANDPILKSLPLRPLLSLRNVVLIGWSTDDLNDIGMAFGETLTSLVFSCIPRNQFGAATAAPEALSEFRLGKYWKLPTISILSIHAPSSGLMVDPDFYTNCLGNTLERLELTDQSSEPFESNMDLYICRPAVQAIPACTKIARTGWPALTFHPDTLHQVPNLTVLELASWYWLYVEESDSSLLYETDSPAATANRKDDDNHGSRDFHHSFPSIDQRRSLWTWDWYLPRLDFLRLDGIFAYLFQFQMLAGCPSLSFMELNMSASDVDQHHRTLTLQDFIHPDSSPNDQGNDSKQKLIVASSIQSITLCGEWIIDEEQREAILREIFTGLTTLEQELDDEVIWVGSN